VRSSSSHRTLPSRPLSKCLSMRDGRWGGEVNALDVVNIGKMTDVEVLVMVVGGCSAAARHQGLYVDISFSSWSESVIIPDIPDKSRMPF